MSVSNIIDEATGKIDPKYIPAIAPPATPNLNQVLTAGNQTGGVLIDAQGGNVICDAMKCISIESATAPLFNDIAVDANLITAQFGKTGFSADALITCNEQNSTKKVIETTNASTNAIYKVAEGNINYETQTKILTVNPLSFPPSPLLSTQGLVVNGSVKAPFLGSTLTPYSQVIGYDSVSGQLIAQPAGVQNPMISNLDAGNYMITNANDIQTNSIFISKGGVQPRVEFQDGTGFVQGQVGWNSITGKTIMQGSSVLINTDNTNKYKIEMGDHIGYLGVETNGVDTEIRHYDATATTMETRVRVEAGGKVSITEGLGATAILRLENNGGKGGSVIADEVNGECRFEAQDGYKAVFKEANANTRLVFDNTIADTVSLKADGQPTIRFEESGGAYIDLKAIPTASELQAQTSYFSASSGAVEGVKIGSDMTNNIVGGFGLPLVVAQNYSDLYTNTIKFESGSITTTADALVGIATNNAASAIGFTAGAAGANLDIVANGDDTGKISLIAQTSLTPAEITIDGSSTQGIITAKADIIEFSGASLQSGSSSGNSGQHLVIKLNGTTYKIKLELP